MDRLQHYLKNYSYTIFDICYISVTMGILDELPQYLFPTLRKKRLVNCIIDLLGTIPVILLVEYFIEALLYMIAGEEMAMDYRNTIDYGTTRSSFFLSFGTSSLGGTLYYVAFEYGLKGKTLGKYFTRTRAVRQDGTSMTFTQTLERSLIRIVPMEPFSFLGGNVLAGWHD